MQVTLGNAGVLPAPSFREQITALVQRQTDLFNQIPPFGIGDAGSPAREAIFAEIAALQEQRL